MELRPDIATAASRMASGYDVSRELRQLGTYLQTGETVQRLASGMYGAGAGLLSVTNHRVLFLRDGRSGHASEGFPIGRLSTADWSPEGTLATISVSDSSSTAVLRQVDSADARSIVELIRQSTGNPPGGAPNGLGSRVGVGATSSNGPGDGFLPGGRTLGGASTPGGPAPLFQNDPGIRQLPDRQLPDTASATTMTFNRPVEAGPGWAGVHGIPAPSGPVGSGGSVPVSALAGSGSVPLPPPAPVGSLPYVPRQHGAVESSGPLGLSTNLVGEVPIRQLAAEDSGPFEAVPDIERSYAPAHNLDAPTTAIAANQAKAPQSNRTGGFIPDIEPADDHGAAEASSTNLTAEGTERPQPITWRAPAGGKATPLHGAKAGKTQKTGKTQESAEQALASEPATHGHSKKSSRGKESAEDFSHSFGGMGGAGRSRWMWLAAGAAALVGLAAIGSVKLLGSNGSSSSTPVSPIPAAAVTPPATPAGPVVQVSKVVSTDQIEVTGQYTGTVEVLGIKSPSANSCGADQARQFAIDTLRNQTVTLVADPNQPDTDASGRKLSYLQLSNNSDYSTQAVAAGMAKYFDGGKPGVNAPQIKTAQSSAEQGKEGLWGSPCNGKFAGASSSASSTSSSGSTDATDGTASSDGSNDSTSSTTSGSSSKTTKSKSSHKTSSHTGTTTSGATTSGN